MDAIKKMKNKLREREREKKTFFCEKTKHRMKKKMSNL